MKHYGLSFVKQEVNELLLTVHLKKSDTCGVVVYVIIVVTGFTVSVLTVINLWRSAFPVAPQATTTVANIASQQTSPSIPETNSVILQTGANSTAVQNINQIATYKWVNADSWKAATEQAGRVSVDLRFTTEGEILPSRACLFVKADNKILDIGHIGVSYNYVVTIHPQIGSVSSVCFSGLNKDELFQVFFDAMPSKIEATLVKQ